MDMEQFDFTKAFAKRTIKPRFPVYDPPRCPPRSRSTLRASRTHALLDVQTADYPGLLYPHWPVAIADAKLNLSSARINHRKGRRARHLLPY